MSAPPTRRGLLISAAGVAGMALLAGCTGGTAASPGKPGGPVSIVAYSGVTGQYTNNWNPFSPAANVGTRGVVYESMAFTNQAKPDDVQPQLAEKFEWNEDSTEITFTVRKGVTWSDGKPFTAEDVAFTYDLFATNEKINTTALPYEGVEQVGEDQVKVTFESPQLVNQSKVLGVPIVPKHVWEKIEDPTTVLNEKPVGTGPFTLKSFASQNYVFTRNKDYWEEGKPAIDQISFRSFSGNQSAQNALLAGQLDWASIFIPDVEKTFVAKNPEVNSYEAFQTALTTMVPNLEKGPTKELAVRKAISLGLDRAQLNKVAWSGLSAMPNAGSLLQPRDADYVSPEIADAEWSADAEAAQAELEEAGWKKGSDGVYAKDGERLELTCQTVSGFTDVITALQVAQQQMKKIGIDFKVKENAQATFADNMQRGKFDLLVWNLNPGNNAYATYKTALHTSSSAPLGEIANGNFARYRNAEVDKLLDEAEKSSDQAVVQENMRRISEIFVEEMPYIPLLQGSALAEYRTAKVTGFPTEENPYAQGMAYADVGMVAKNLKPAK